MTQGRGSSGKNGKTSARSSTRDSSGGARGSSRSSSSNRSTKTKAAKEKELQRIKRKRQSAAVILFAFAILMFVLVVFPGIGNGLSSVIYGLFGIMSIFWCFLLFYLAILLALDRPDSNIKVKIIQAGFIILLISSFIYIAIPMSKELDGSDMIDVVNKLYKYGCSELGLARGSGLIGGLFGALLVSLLGRVLSGIIVLLTAFVMVMLLTNTGLIQLFKSVSTPVRNAAGRAHEIAESRAAAREERELERERSSSRDSYDELRRARFGGDSSEHSSRRVKQPSLTEAERRRRDFQVDIPIDDDPIEMNNEPKRRITRSNKQSSDDAVSDVLRTLSEENKQKKSPVKKPLKPTSRKTEIDDDDDSGELEALIQRVAGTKTKRERVEEIARETVDFAREVENNNDDSSPMGEYMFPPVELLTPQEDFDEGDIRSELKENADLLVKTLAEYNVKASVVNISRGPAVTRYELEPAPGIKISRITSLSNDIALRLAAPSVRIEAPIPGKAAVGVEIPNIQCSIVRIRELIESDQFRDAKSPLTVAVGRDIEGKIITADLAGMPHLLIAGSTGTGKSVCINSMLVSLIYKSSPEDVRLIMVDPKKVELDVYNGIPHLLVPVVCDPKKAAGALQWAVTEMDRRYELLNEHGVRNINGYNALAEKDGNIEKMPRIVIVIDEMADLMATSPKEVESAIARLAAMARAAGMHMVLATQRPSVDVITGTIKNNIPSRIAFKVTSQVDSRTILDESGADELIGKGDMLFKPISKPKRIQGCLVTDEEVESAVAFIKQNGSADYDENIAKEIERNVAAADSKNGMTSGGEEMSSGADDPMFNKAIEAVIEAGQASTSMLQRRLGVGYARAGRLIDQLADRGIIGPFEGSKPRRVLMTRQEYLEMTMSHDSSEPVPASKLSILSMTDNADEMAQSDEDDGFDAPPF